MTKKPRRVVLYARCSTNEEKQDVENQLIQLRESCTERGWTILHEYIDYESGSKGREQRLEFNTMLESASRKEFDLVYFWRLDRFTREGIKKTVYYLDLLQGWGVGFKSHKDTYLDTDNELVKHILLGVLSYFAQQELVKISENTKIGLEKAKRKGKRLGRPPLTEARKQAIRTKAKELGSAKAASRELGVPYSTVKKVLNSVSS